MRPLIALWVAGFAACSSSSPQQTCPVIRPTGAGGGDALPVPGGVIGEPVNLPIHLQLPIDCRGMALTASRVDVSVLDPDNNRVIASATPPTQTFSEADTTVTFTPMKVGSFHVTVRFDPNLGSVQTDVSITGAGGPTDGGGGGSGGGGGAECDAGASETRACSRNGGPCRAGEQQRSCSASASWQPWSPCHVLDGGTEPVTVPAAELCGNQIDDDCNGAVDEGCACQPVAPGDGGVLLVSGTISKLKSDQARCRLYALEMADSRLVVIDTRTKTALAEVALPANPSDFDVSPDGQRLVVGFDGGSMIAAVDPNSFAVTMFSTSLTAYALEAGDDGYVYFTSEYGGTGISWLDLDTGVASPFPVVGGPPFEAELELSNDGRLFSGGYNLIPGEVDLREFSADAGSTPEIAETVSAPGGDVPYPLRKLYLCPAGRHFYYGLYQWDALNLGSALGEVGEAVLVEDQAESFAVGTRHVFDARTLTPVSPALNPIDAAALSAADHEVWLYSGGLLTYQNVAELVPP